MPGDSQREPEMAAEGVSPEERTSALIDQPFDPAHHGKTVRVPFEKLDAILQRAVCHQVITVEEGDPFSFCQWKGLIESARFSAVFEPE